jgi:hypothetical protein
MMHRLIRTLDWSSELRWYLLLTSEYATLRGLSKERVSRGDDEIRPGVLYIFVGSFCVNSDVRDVFITSSQFWKFDHYVSCFVFSIHNFDLHHILLLCLLDFRGRKRHL